MTARPPTYHDTVQPIIEETEHPLTAAFLAVAWETGARPIEVAALTVDDLTETGFGFELDLSGKGRGRTVEVVAATPFLRNWLQHRPQHDTGDRALWTKRSKSGELSIDTLRAMVQEAASHADVDMSLYDLRRSEDAE